MRYIAGCSASLTGRARMARIAILSEFQYPYAVVPTPISAKTQMNCPPLNSEPMPSSSTQMEANSSVVFSPLKWRCMGVRAPGRGVEPAVRTR